MNRENGKKEIYQGDMFVDATYEGDLGAAAGVPFRIGRESKAEFGEPGAGRAYEYWKSLPASGSTGEADNAVQAYNYRLCLTMILKFEFFFRNRHLTIGMNMCH